MRTRLLRSVAIVSFLLVLVLIPYMVDVSLYVWYLSPMVDLMSASSCFLLVNNKLMMSRKLGYMND